MLQSSMAVTASRISSEAVLGAGYPDLMRAATEMQVWPCRWIGKGGTLLADSDVFWTNHRTSSLDKVAALMAEDLFTA